MKIRLKMAQLVQPVPIAGYSNRLNNQTAVLIWDDEAEAIFAEARAKEKGAHKRLVVPLDAVVFMEPMSDEDLLAELQAEEAAKAKAAAPPPAPPAHGRKAALAGDTKVFRKNKGGEIVEMSKAEAAKQDAEDA